MKALKYALIGVVIAGAALLLATISFAEEKNETTKIRTVKVSDIKEFNADKFVKKVPLDTDKIVFNTFYFKPRQFLPFHKHPATDELFYIVSGVGRIYGSDENIIVGPRQLCTVRQVFTTVL